MRWKRVDVGVGLLRGILERLENIPMCMGGSPATHE